LKLRKENNSMNARTSRRLTPFVLLGLAAVLSASAGWASGPPGQGSFGTTNDNYYRLSSSQFTGRNGAPYRDDGAGGSGVNRYTTAVFGILTSALQLPAGAMIDSVELDSCEFNANYGTSVLLLDCDSLGTACTNVPGTGSGAQPNSGCGRTVFPLTPYGPIDNLNREYILDVFTPAGDNSESFSGVTIGYKLQVSPAPATASFVDVPTTSPIFKFVEALKASGITAGCDATHFCPNNSLTRGQMAVFLAAALGLQWQ
jgi:S-layer family protein